MDSKPDNRKDNVERIQRNINNTILNMELADDMIETTSDDRMRETLKDKNDRREDSLDSMRKEIADEAHDRENGYDR